MKQFCFQIDPSRGIRWDTCYMSVYNRIAGGELILFCVNVWDGHCGGTDCESRNSAPY